MKRTVYLSLILALMFISACTYPVKDAKPLAATYQRSAASDGHSAMLYLVLKQGTFQLTAQEGGVLWQGTYKIGADQMVFAVEDASEAGKAVCGDDDEFAYRWSYETHAGALSLEKIEDACPGREHLLSGGAWSMLKTEEPTETEHKTTPAAKE